MGAENRVNPWCRAYLGLVAFSIFGQLASSLFHVDPGWIRPLAGLATLTCGVMAMVAPIWREFGSHRAFAILSGVLSVGIAAEVCGIYTGLPFGKYTYTHLWWPTVGLPGGQLFPLPLPFAWLMMVAAGYFLFARDLSGWVAILSGAVVITLVDIPMEWAMVSGLKYWKWLDPSWPLGDMGFGVPWLNCIGWFGTALVAGWLLDRAKVHQVDVHREARWVLGGHMVLMLVLALIPLSMQTPMASGR